MGLAHACSPASAPCLWDSQQFEAPPVALPVLAMGRGSAEYSAGAARLMLRALRHKAEALSLARGASCLPRLTLWLAAFDSLRTCNAHPLAATAQRPGPLLVHMRTDVIMAYFG